MIWCDGSLSILHHKELRVCVYGTQCYARIPPAVTQQIQEDRSSRSMTLFCIHRSVLEPLAQWDSPMQVKLSCWKFGLNTLLIELLPWALLANYSQWDLWLFEGETIVLQIPAGKVIVPPNLKVACSSRRVFKSLLCFINDLAPTYDCTITVLPEEENLKMNKTPTLKCSGNVLLPHFSLNLSQQGSTPKKSTGGFNKQEQKSE